MPCLPRTPLDKCSGLTDNLIQSRPAKQQKDDSTRLPAASEEIVAASG